MVAFSAGVSAAVYTFSKVLSITKELRNGNGNGKSQRTFSTDAETYWQRMKETVTEPLGIILVQQTKVLDKQVESNTEIMQKLVLLEDRTPRFIRSEDRAPWTGEERRRGPR